VKHKRASQFFWKILENVKADGLIEQGRIRYFILEDETYIEMSTKGMQFVFSPERSDIIAANAKAVKANSN